MSVTETPLHVEILLNPPTPSPNILPTPELTLLQTTIESTLKSQPTCKTMQLPLQSSLSSLVLPTTTSPLRVSKIRTTLCEDDPSATMPSWQVTPVLHLYTHSPLRPTAYPPGASVTPLPSPHLRCWETLHFKQPLKSITLSYILTRHSYPFLPSSGFLLLHGPPGTGKSSLAEALAQKMSIRLGQGYLVRLTHETLSKYFGESANRIAGVFNWAISQTCIVAFIIDEIETFGMCRTTNDTGGDGIRLTNALLTALDAVRKQKNIVVIGTSNSIKGVDAAIRDRADVCLNVCDMDAEGRDAVLKGVLEGLVQSGVLDSVGDTSSVARLCNGLSARRVEGSVIVALGLAGHGKVQWPAFEKALRRAVVIARDAEGDVDDSCVC